MTSKTTLPAPNTATVHAPAADAPAARPVRRPMAMGAEPVWMALFDPARFTTMKQMAGILLKSGFLPRAVNSEEKVITILIKGYELGLPPMEALTGISVIDGKPAVSPQLMIALINRSGQLKDLVVDGDDTKCSVTMTRRGRKPHTETFTIDDARRMKSKDGDGNIIPLADKYNWRQMPAVMLRWRAVSACARVVFPDVISGVYTPEEMGADVTVDDEGAMQVVDPEPAPRGPAQPRTPNPPGRSAPVTEEPAPAASTPSADRRLVDVPANVDPTTGEMMEERAPHSPSAGTAAPGASERPASVQANATVPPVSADTGGHRLTPEHGAAITDDSQELTPEAAKALRGLIAEAARLEGFTGKTATRAWVTAHYGITNGKLEDVAPELRARMRADALTSIAARKPPTNDEAAAEAVPVAPSASGNSQSTPAPQPDASAQSAAPTGALPASAEQLEAIQRECTIRGIVTPQDNPGIMQSARRSIARFDELTQAEADRVLRYLKYVPLRTAHAAPPA
jgi:hypothetical protein